MVFTVAQKHPMMDGMTISRDIRLGQKNIVTWFSLGRETDIGQESYDHAVFYLGAEGKAEFLIGTPVQKRELSRGDFLLISGHTLCGVQSAEGAVYTEIMMKKEFSMNNVVKAGQAIQLKELISYVEGSISNMDIVKNETMKFVLMAFDAGTGLSPHRAPGNAIITAIEGSAVIGYEGKEYTLSEGESFRFEKNGLHSVTANGQFKMSLLLVLE